MADYTYKAFNDFLHYLGDRGLIKATTAQGYRVAASKIEDALTEQEMADVRHLDVSEVFQRYANKTKLQISPGTLRTYRGRLEKALHEFLAWREDPAAFKPRTGSQHRSGEKNVKAEQKNTRVTPAAKPIEATTTAGSGILTLPYPLRADFLASIQLPRDLKLEEAERLGAFIRTLAIDYKP